MRRRSLATLALIAMIAAAVVALARRDDRRTRERTGPLALVDGAVAMDSSGSATLHFHVRAPSRPKAVVHAHVACAIDAHVFADVHDWPVEPSPYEPSTKDRVVAGSAFDDIGGAHLFGRPSRCEVTLSDDAGDANVGCIDGAGVEPVRGGPCAPAIDASPPPGPAPAVVSDVDLRAAADGIWVDWNVTVARAIAGAVVVARCAGADGGSITGAARCDESAVAKLAPGESIHCRGRIAADPGLDPDACTLRFFAEPGDVELPRP